MRPSARLSIRSTLNRARRALWRALFGRMLFGEMSGGEPRPATRLAPTVIVEHADRLQLADDVFIGPFVFIEASAGVRIATGVQIASFVSIVSHSTDRSVRAAKALSGLDLGGAAPAAGLPGDRRAAVELGAHAFVGPHSTLEAGTRLGACCLVASHSRVRGVIPDFSIVAGSPARVVGDVREGDAAWLARQAAEHGLDAAPLHAAYRRWAQGVQAGTPPAPAHAVDGGGRKAGS